MELVWYSGAEIRSSIDPVDGVVIEANAAGLRTLAGFLLTLADETVPVGHHVHLDDASGLAGPSTALLLIKSPSGSL